MASIGKTERLLNLIAFFLNAKEPKDLREIAKIEGYRGKSLDALRQAFYRDRRELAEMGLSISYDPEREGYFLPPEQRYLPTIDFSPEEILALRLLKQLVESRADFPWKNALKIGLEKILLDAEPEEEVSFNIPIVFDLQTHNESEEIAKVLDRAISLRKEVSFLYKPLRKSKVERWYVQPYLLFQKEKVWYLVAFSPQHGDYRTFRLSRIQGKVKILQEEKEGPDFERDPDFNPEDYYFMFPWEFGSDQPMEVKVKFSPKAAFLVEKSSSKILEKREDGSGILLFKVKDEDAFVQWLLSFAEDAEVLGPDSTRKKMLEALERIERAYSDAAT